MTHLGTVELETQRLILRRFKTDDAEKMYENWASEEEVARYLTWCAHPSAEVTRGLVSEWVNRYEKNDCYNWVIELKDTGEIIGSISVVQIKEDVKSAMLGYCMGTRWWGQGIMPEAGKAVVKFLFEQVGFNRIEAYHDKNNPKSGKVMQKIGMTYEGTLRSAGLNNRGNFIDEVRYAVLREDYDGKAATER